MLNRSLAPTGVDEAPAAATLRLLPPVPNPSRGGAEVTFSLPRPGEGLVTVLDAAGRRVAELHRGPLGAGLHHLRWYGCDARGRAVAGGIYWVCVQHDGARRTQKLVVMR